MSAKLTDTEAHILRIIGDRNGPIPGAEVADARGGWERSGTYLALANLQRDGLVAAQWDTSGPHPRRLFTLTGNGRAILDHTRALDLLLRTREERW